MTTRPYLQVQQVRKLRFLLCTSVFALFTQLTYEPVISAPADAAKSIGTDELFEAARRGNVERLRVCIASGIGVDVTNELGETPLMIVVAGNHKECVAWLLSQGADPNHQDMMDRSAVSRAAELTDDSSTLKMLLEFKGNPNLRARVRRLPDGTIVRLRPTPIYNAIEAMSYDNVSLLISMGADVDPEVDNDWNSPLGSAALHYNFDIVYLLLENGADFRAPGPNPPETIADFLAQVDVDLIIGAHIRDSKERAKWEQGMRDWYSKVRELLKEKEADMP